MKLIETKLQTGHMVTLMTNMTLNEKFTLVIADATNTELIRFNVEKEADAIRVEEIWKKVMGPDTRFEIRGKVVDSEKNVVWTGGIPEGVIKAKRVEHPDDASTIKVEPIKGPIAYEYFISGIGGKTLAYKVVGQDWVIENPSEALTELSKHLEKRNAELLKARSNAENQHPESHIYELAKGLSHLVSTVGQKDEAEAIYHKVEAREIVNKILEATRPKG